MEFFEIGSVGLEGTALMEEVSLESGFEVSGLEVSHFFLQLADMDVEVSVTFLAPCLPAHCHVPHHDANGLVSNIS